jgi:hypothetical protein
MAPPRERFAGILTSLPGGVACLPRPAGNPRRRLVTTLTVTRGRGTLDGD